MDIYQVLKKDHDELKPLLDRLVTATEHNDSTKQLLDDITDLLIPHARAEEAVFYNSLKGLVPTKDVVKHGFREHMEAEVLLRTLRGLERINIKWTTSARKLRDSVFHHIAEEENEIFSAAKKVLLQEEANQMVGPFEELKAKAENQGDFKNTIDMAANLMPKRFVASIRGYELPHV